jgi:hypothetical protein
MNQVTPLTTTSNMPLPRRRPSALLWGGLCLILSGLGLLLTTGPLRADNWWAIFILLPGLAALGAAVLQWQASGGAFNLWVRLNLITALPVLAVALIFVFRVDWSIGWTLMLIVPGLALWLNGFTTPRLPLGSLLRSLATLVGWCGLSTAVLGATFLLDRLGAIHLAQQFGAARWWSAFILLPGLGALLSALVARLGHGRPEGLRLLVGCGLWLVAVAACEFIGLAAPWYAPLLLTLAGLVLIGQAHD